MGSELQGRGASRVESGAGGELEDASATTFGDELRERRVLLGSG